MKQTYNVGYLQTPSVKHLANVKQALADTGLVSPTTPNEMLPDAIEEGVNALKEQITPTWENIDLSTKKKLIIKDLNYYFICSNEIDCYCQIYSEPGNLYHLNLQTGVLTPILSTNKIFSNFIETSNGDVYATFTSATGIYKLTPTSANIIYENGSWSLRFVSSSDVVYATNTSYSRSDILHISGNTCTLIKISGYGWNNFYESSDGTIYAAGSNSSSLGVLCLNGTTATQIYTTNYGWNTFFETSNGDVYVFGAISAGILKLSPTQAKQLVTSNTLTSYFIDSNENIYLGGTSCTGFYILKNGTATQFLKDKTGYTVFFESSKGNVYASGGSLRIACVNNNNATSIYEGSSGWTNYFESSNGKIYVSNTSYTGVVCINEQVATFLAPSSSDYKYFIERQDGIILATTKNPDGQEFYFIDKENDQVYLMRE